MKASSLLQPDVIGVFVGIVGIVLACVFYIRSKEQVKPRVLIVRTTLIGKSGQILPESVEIRYNDKSVPALSKVRIVFWNAGKKTLDESDVAKHDPIRIKLPETQVLDIRSVTSTREVINAGPTLEGDTIRLSFDFLDQNDGLALEAFYSSESETKITLSGTIKGVRKGIEVKAREGFVSHYDPSAPDMGFLFAVVPLLGMSGFSTYLILTGGRLDWVAVLVAVLSGVTAIIVLIFGVYSYFHGRIPHQLRQDPSIATSADLEMQSHQQGIATDSQG